MKPTSFLVLALVGGCSLIKVNGKPLGGGDPPAPSPPASGATSTETSARIAANSGTASSALALPTTAPALKVSRAALAPRLTTPLIKIAVESPADELGFRCGQAHAQGYTTRAPALSWEVTEDLDLSVRLVDTWDGGSAIVVFPDGSTLCADNNELRPARWPKGRYHLFLTSSGSTAAGKVMFSSEAQARAGAPVIAIKAATSAPVLATTSEVVYKGGYNRVFNDNNYQLSCTTNNVSEVPSAFVEVEQPTKTMRISVWGKNHDGTVIRAGGKTWISCSSFFPAPEGGWPAGKIEIYPMGRLAEKGNQFLVAVDDPAVPARDDAVHHLTLDKKLAKPLFVTVPMRKARNVLPEELSGSRCRGAAFAGIPDVIVTTERPLPGLVIRPLATANPITALVRYPKQSYCVESSGSMGGKRGRDGDTTGAFDAPTWRSTTDVGQVVTEGEFELQLGSWPGKDVSEVTLMIYDDSTELSPLDVARVPVEAYGDRAVARVFPQLDVHRVTRLDRAGLELAAALFAAAPHELFVTPKLALDADLAHALGVTAAGTFPAKGEPLLVLDNDRDRATVLTADGLTFQLERKHLVDLGAGSPVVPAKPRPIAAATKIETVGAMLPKTDKGLTAFHEAVAQRQKCRDAAWAPYGRQLPTITRPAGVDLVIVTNPAYDRIEAAGNAAMDRTCGTDEAFAKKTEGMRVKMLAAFEASRQALLATATASFK